MSNLLAQYKYPELWHDCICALCPSLDQWGSTILLDNSERQNPGRVYGSSAWDSDNGSAILSRSVNHLVGVSNVGKLIGTGPFTISMWARQGSSTVVYLSGNTSYGNSISKSNTAWYAGPGFMYNWTPPPDFFHIAATRDEKGTFTLYLNGINRGATATYTAAFGNDYCFLGYGPFSGGWGASNGTKGDDFRVYRRALPAQQINTLSLRRRIAYECDPTPNWAFAPALATRSRNYAWIGSI